jgi:histone H3/H4
MIILTCCAQVSQGLSGPYRDILNTYWQNQVWKLEQEEHDYKLHQLPLARIKKVMKADPDVKMISAEAPILFAKGCDIFITELTMRAWIHAEENKRRTLQRSDIASALAKSDMFDFLIDIVPREDATPSHKRRPEYNAQGAYTVPEAAQDAGDMGVAQGYGASVDQSHLPSHAQYQQQMGGYPPQQHAPPPPPGPYAGQPMFDPTMYPGGGGYSMAPMQGMPQQNVS